MPEDFGDFDFADDQDFGKGGAADKKAEAPRQQQRKASARAGMYAKSPQQRRADEENERDFQEALREAKAEKEGGRSGFDGGGDAPAGGQAGGFQIWGKATGPGSAGIVIPPFVPRDKRGTKTWDVGGMSKAQCDKSLKAGRQGDFLIRETAKGDRHVIAVHDAGTVFEQYIRHPPEGGFMFSSRQFDSLEKVVDFLKRNPMYNRHGLPLYIDKPCNLI